jgi:hypothetical protein
MLVAWPTPCRLLHWLVWKIKIGAVHVRNFRKSVIIYLFVSTYYVKVLARNTTKHSQSTTNVAPLHRIRIPPLVLHFESLLRETETWRTPIYLLALRLRRDRPDNVECPRMTYVAISDSLAHFKSNLKL